MTKVIWNENGQGEFDFEYLLNLTSEEFIEEFKNYFDVLSSRNRKVVVKIEESYCGNTIHIYLTNGGTCVVYDFYKESKIFKSSSIGSWQIVIFHQMLTDLGDSND